MNLKEIREIINLMNENDLAEIEIEREGSKIKIRRSASGAPEVVYHQPVIQNQESKPTSSEGQETVKESSGNNHEIISPMVGTFYRAPSPDAPLYVEKGQVVEIGQVVCIVEAMKLMNEIKSEYRGKIVEISTENAQPVEFGQTLFVIEPV